MQLSVVIPTRNRRDRLAETLDALAEDALAEEFTGDTAVDGGFEVIVVDDGSDPGHLDALQSAPRPFPCRWLQQTGLGPAAARNRGVQEACGERILFLGDDTRPAPGCLAVHAAGEDTGIQGHIDWDPHVPVSEVMDFLAPEGPQFYFRGLRPGEPVPYTAVLGSNASFPRRWLVDEPFDEGFPAAAFEDTELAWRFDAHGWSTLYRPDALCWHHHPYPTLDPFLQRQRRAGHAARHAVGKHPRLAGPVVLWPTLFTGVVFARHLLRSATGRRRPRDLWDLRCRLAFLRGFLGGFLGR